MEIGGKKEFTSYDELFNYSIGEDTREDYWKQISTEVEWIKKPTKILDMSNPPFVKWFPDATTNITLSCVDRWARDTPDVPALIYEGRLLGKTEVWTYKKLKEEVEIMSGVLVNFGITKGDVVVIYMPMINLGVCAMLACARVGAIHTVVFGGFSSKE